MMGPMPSATDRQMDLYLRKVIHPQADDNYRVVLKDYIPEVEIGSIGIQHATGARTFWRWAIDTVLPMRDLRHGAPARIATTA